MTSETESDGESMTVLFIIVCFLLSLFAKELNSRCGIPYTPQLIFFGILLGYQSFLGQITSAVGTLMLIHPHAILTIFLPILIFESSFNARLPSLSTNFLQILTLIILVVIISFLLIACVLKVIIGYNSDDLSWWHALTLGTILSATDPVAVVALLKELGAPVHINTIIEMESLFNDGSAMVFFTIFQKFTTGLTMTINESIILFLRLAFGGIGAGITFALAALLLLQFLQKGKTLFLHIIVAGSYSVFYVGEHIWGVSGLLAVVSFGLMLNKFMKDQMTNEQVHQAESVVTFIQLINESLLFFFAGIIVGHELRHQFLVNLQYPDWGYILVLFIFVIIIRLVAISLFFPILTRTGEGFTYNEVALSVWGGLRGALSIALALSVYHNFEIPEGRAKMLILFLTCGIASLTLIVNGTTAKCLVSKINLILNLRARYGFQSLFLKQVKQVGIKTLGRLRKDAVFSMTHWKGVEEIVQFDLIDLERKYIRLGEVCLIRTVKRKMEESKSLYRYSILRHLMKFLDDDLHDGYFHQTIHSIIEEAILQCCEDPFKPILILERCNRSFRTYKFLKSLRQQPYFRMFKSSTQIFFLGVLNDKFSLLDLLQQCLVKTITLQKNYDKFVSQEVSVLEELQIELGLVEDEIQEIKNLHPDELTKLSQKDAALKILRKQAHYLDGKMGNLIAENEGVQLRDDLFQKFNNVQSVFSTIKLKSGMNLLLSAAFQGIIESTEIERILFQKQSLVFKKDQDIPFETNFFLILKGQVEETVFNHGNSIQLEYGPSSIIGLSKIVDKDLCITAKANSEIVEIVHFSFNFNDVKFTKFLFQRSLPELLKIHSNVHCIQNMSAFELLNFANECDILLNQESIFPTNGGFILRGEFSCAGKADQKYGLFETILPQSTMMQSSSLFNAVVLFKEGIADKKTFRRQSVQNKVYPAQQFEDTIIEKNNESGVDKSVVVNDGVLDKSAINNSVISENKELIK